MDEHSTPLPLHSDDELDLKVGMGLLAVVVESGFQKISDLRSALAADGKRLPLIRVRDNPTLGPFSFLLHDSGRQRADGDFATIGDVLQSLSGAARQDVAEH